MKACLREILAEKLSVGDFALNGGFFVSMARDLRGPGLRACFCPAAKVGKNALRKLPASG